MYGNLVNDNGIKQPSVTVTCPECGRTESAWGQEERSIKRACWLLSTGCDEAPDLHFYKTDVQARPHDYDSEPRDEIPF